MVPTFSNCGVKTGYFGLESSRPKPVQSQQNNVRTRFTERCCNVIFLTLNRFLLAGVYSNRNTLGMISYMR